MKKKQKRNKPTLSCLECVERKTKVRRPLMSMPAPQLELRRGPIAVLASARPEKKESPAIVVIGPIRVPMSYVTPCFLV